MKFKKNKSSIKENIILKQKWYLYIQITIFGVALFLLCYWLINDIFINMDSYYARKAHRSAIYLLVISQLLLFFLFLRGCFQYYIFTETGICRIRFNKKKNSRLYPWNELRVTLPKTTVKLPDHINAYRGGLFISTKKITPFKLFGFEIFSFCEINKSQTNHLDCVKLMLKHGNFSNESLKNLQGYIEYYDKNSRI